MRLNEKRLRRIQRTITTKPDKFDMDTWGCGTTCCVGGWALVDSGCKVKSVIDSHKVKDYETGKIKIFKDRNWYFVDAKGRKVRAVETRAAKALGLTAEQAGSLFHSHMWPAPFNAMFGEATSDVARASVAALRIEHLIEKGE